jgi:exodeoxyribonuclease VII large subunit
MSLKCFATAWNLRVPIEDGMKIQLVAKPRLGKYGFSLNVEAVKPVGEGSIKKAFEMLRRKLENEGLFAPERKRVLPELPQSIGVISSTAAAGYKDFIKILGQRFGGIKIAVADVAVQGDTAADQVVGALDYFNECENPPEIIAILRGGGSRDDLVAFDDELLVRAIAGSRVPTIVGVGHEVDITLADLAADVRAATPSNAAQILVPDRREITADLAARLNHTIVRVENRLVSTGQSVTDNLAGLSQRVDNLLTETEQRLSYLSTALKQLNPQVVLNRGYCLTRQADGQLLRDKPRIGDKLQIETAKFLIDSTVDAVS